MITCRPLLIYCPKDGPAVREGGGSFGSKGQVDPPSLDGRTPVIPSPDRPGKGKQAIDDPVLFSRHAAQNPFKRLEGMAKGDELKPPFGPGGPRHGPADHEGRRGEGFLGAPFDMRRQGGLGDFPVRPLVPADDQD